MYFVYCSLGLGHFSGSHINNVCGMAYHPRTGFHYCKLPTYLSDEYGSFTNISDIDLGESGYR